MLGDVPRPALWLGLAGLVPFVAGAAGTLALPFDWAVYAYTFLLYYAGVGLGALGAVHWGLAMAGYGGGITWTRLGWASAAPVVAWLALAMTPPPALVTLFLAYAVAFFAEVRAARRGLVPGWYVRLRRPLSVVVLAALAAALLRVV